MEEEEQQQQEQEEEQEQEGNAQSLHEGSHVPPGQPLGRPFGFSTMGSSRQASCNGTPSH